VVDEAGATLWSKKIDNDETAILTALGEILNLADEVHWAVDISGTSSARLSALPAVRGQQAVYVPGRTVNRMAGAYRGEMKTDARDAYVIAETARHRRDFYLKKHGEDGKHVQAVIALAHRRAGVLLRDNRDFTPTPPVAQAVRLHH
jgi:hypothetical protein